MFLMPAKYLERFVHGNEKHKRFLELVTIQQRKIVSSMKQGFTSVVWIFNDPDYYRNTLEKEWKSDFNAKAVDVFKAAGYFIAGKTIHWEK